MATYTNTAAGMRGINLKDGTTIWVVRVRNVIGFNRLARLDPDKIGRAHV